MDWKRLDDYIFVKLVGELLGRLGACLQMRSKRVSCVRECSERRRLLPKPQFVWMELHAHKTHYPSVTEKEEKLRSGMGGTSAIMQASLREAWLAAQD